MRPAFIIHEKLPGFNEYESACRAAWAVGAKMKRETKESIAWAIKAQKVRKYWNPVRIKFRWHEPPNAKGRYRDPDNIASAKKYILDAMTATLVIHDDDRSHVIGFEDEFRWEKKGENYGVEVFIEEIERGW